MTEDAVYRFDLTVTFTRYPREITTVTPICSAATASVTDLLTAAGYKVARVGHGSLRLDKPE